MRKTEKLYYQDPYRISTTATVVRIDDDALALDRTIAYPEGGGQEAEIRRIGDIANRYIEADHPIRLYASEQHPDARYWECAGQVMPCGGTHIERTGPIGHLTIKRKNIGKGKERVICMLPELEYSVAQYR
ncbi:hypothetical protein [Marinobacterium ramblicola]|uniref:hypothetical protein n=1 Tax=Marinobacterium ramblicola TaxID=2849041 RepID=UPI001FECB88A|nr:hypothetical protein [Marinobacterium ramblicola]